LIRGPAIARAAARLVVFLAVSSVAIVAGLASVASAQELDSSDPEFGESAKVNVVPRLGGALSLDMSLGYRFDLGNDDALPQTSIGGSVGYRHFFDWHGRLSLRGYAALRYGGISNAAVDGTVWQYGGGVSLHARGYTDTWAFGGIGVYAELLATDWTPPVGILGQPERELGWKASAGLETDFGQLIVADPYVFAESSALFGLNYIDVGPWRSWSIDARWVVRFDWAWRPSANLQLPRNP
jgi:hypothetical protein